jgi:predicted PurR-regulated permease PerM
MSKFLLVALLAASFTASAATPSEVQTLIDQGNCSQALSVINSEMTANPNKTSDVLNALMIEASLCDGRINSENKQYALNELKAIENRNPMLIGLNQQDFQVLKQKVSSIDGSSSKSSGGLMIFVLTVLLMLGVGLGYLFFSSSNFERKIKQSDLDRSNETAKFKIENEEKVLSLEQYIYNAMEKARLSGDDSRYNRLSGFMTTLDKAKAQLEQVKSEADMNAVRSKLDNLSVLVKSV